MLDALAPGLLVAQAIGRWGNWFNQELFGRPTDPALGAEDRPPEPAAGLRASTRPSTRRSSTSRSGTWRRSASLICADRRFKLGHGRVIALYVMVYTLGRGWIETLRIDTVELNDVLGLRLNVWTSIVLFVLAAVYFVVVGRRHPGRETEVYTEERLAADRALASVGASPTAGPAVSRHVSRRADPAAEPSPDAADDVER